MNHLKKIFWNTKALFVQFRQLPKGSSLVLLYHGIVEKNPEKFNLRFIALNNFREQMGLLSRQVNVIGIQDIFENKIDPNALNVAIVFDDGYLNNFRFAAPVLEEHHLPATFFITPIIKEGFEYLWTDFLDVLSPSLSGKIIVDGKVFNHHGRSFYSENGITLKEYCKTTNWPFKVAILRVLQGYEEILYRKENLVFWELMKESEIQKLSAEQLFQIGSHGLYHNGLEYLNEAEARNEILTSKKYLEEITKKPIHFFAFPDGSYTRHLLDIVEQEGYRFQLIDRSRFTEDRTDSRLRSRFGANPFLSPRSQMIFLRRGTYHRL